jgi:hypothetical protein
MSMKGILVGEFRRMVEERFGVHAMQELLGSSHSNALASDPRDLPDLIHKLSERFAYSTRDLWRVFGARLFARSAALNPPSWKDSSSTFAVLAAFDNQIHPEVRHFCADGGATSFRAERPDERTLVVTYSSRRSLSDLAEGLIRGCVAHFREPIYVSREDSFAHDGTVSSFVLVRDVPAEQIAA